jgi:hypothetical protein
MTSLGPLSDSQLARVAVLSAKYHELWTITETLRPSFYQNEIAALEKQICDGPKDFEIVCKTARHLASVASNTETPYNEMSWLKQYEPLVSTLNRESDGAQRVAFLRSALSSYDSAIVQSAIQDRLWAEEIALGQRPQQNAPHSYNYNWNAEQECWSDSLSLTSFGACQNTSLHDAMTAIYTMMSDGNPETAHDQLDRLQLGSHMAEFEVLVQAWKSKQTGHLEDFHQYLSRVPRTSPLRKIASQMNQ